MQVDNEHNWTERSLSYLCRTFDQLYQGQPYEDDIKLLEEENSRLEERIKELEQKLLESNS